MRVFAAAYGLSDVCFTYQFLWLKKVDAGQAYGRVFMGWGILVGMIAIVVAMAEGNVIGSQSDLPWYLPADLRRFKKITTGHTVVMGRTTFASIVARLGKPLPNRRNVVLTRDMTFTYEGVETIHHVDEIPPLAETTETTYIIGGAQVYAATMELADRLYVTEVHAHIDGDAYFPALVRSQWREISREAHKADEKNQYDYDFVVYDRA